MVTSMLSGDPQCSILAISCPKLSHSLLPMTLPVFFYPFKHLRNYTGIIKLLITVLTGSLCLAMERSPNSGQISC